MNEENFKIVFVVNSLGFGGSERTVAYLSDYLIRHGDDVSICLIKDIVEYDINSKVKLIKGGFEENSSNLFQRGKNAAKRIRYVNRVLRDEHPDVVFFIIAETAKYVVFNPFRTYKFVVSERANPKSAFKKQIDFKKNIFKKSNGVIFQTQRVKDYYGYNSDLKYAVIPNAIGNPDAYSVQWNPNGRKVISAVGRLTWEKDYKILIDAFERFWQKHNDYVLEIYGTGEDYFFIYDYIHNLGMNSCVQLMGTCKDVLKRISDSKCYVLTSKSEGMPNSLMEAMAIGMPCVSTDCEFGPAELIKSGWNGLLVPVGDAEAVKDALEQFIDNPEYAYVCGMNAKSILLNQNIDTICERIRDFLIEIVK